MNPKNKQQKVVEMAFSEPPIIDGVTINFGDRLWSIPDNCWIEIVEEDPK